MGLLVKFSILVFDDWSQGHVLYVSDNFPGQHAILIILLFSFLKPSAKNHKVKTLVPSCQSGNLSLYFICPQDSGGITL